MRSGSAKPLQKYEILPTPANHLDLFRSISKTLTFQLFLFYINIYLYLCNVKLIDL